MGRHRAKVSLPQLVSWGVKWGLKIDGGEVQLPLAGPGLVGAEDWFLAKEGDAPF